MVQQATVFRGNENSCSKDEKSDDNSQIKKGDKIVQMECKVGGIPRCNK